MDLTGSDPGYLVSDYEFVVFEPGQKIQFRQPVYLNSISIKLVVDETTTMPMTKDVDWSVDLNNVDDDDVAVSEAKLAMEGFAEPIVKSLTMIKTFTAQYHILVTYQRLRNNIIDEAGVLVDAWSVQDEGGTTMQEVLEGIFTGEHTDITYTPGLIAELVRAVTYLQSIVGNNSSVAEAVVPSTILYEDLTGIKAENFIEDELYNIDTTQNKSIIKPAHGSYYAHELVVKNASNSAVFVKNVDYVTLGPNLAKDRIAEHPAAVFDYIHFLIPFTGSVELTYHAFGGEPTVMDYEHLHEAIIVLSHAVLNSGALTTESLPLHTYIIEINARLQYLEDLARWENEDQHRYIFEVSDQGNDQYNWYNIASMYKTPDTGETIHTKSSAHLRLKYNETEYISDVFVTLDLASKQILDVRTINAISSLEPDTTGEDELKVVPVIRAIAVPESNGTITKGVILQLGVRSGLGATPNYNIMIEHVNARNSKIQTWDHTETTPVVRNTDVVMPAGVTVWNALEPTHINNSRLAIPDDGIVVFSGGLLLVNDYVNNTQVCGLSVITEFLQYLNTDATLKLIVRDRVNGQLRSCISNAGYFETVGVERRYVSHTILDIIDGACVKVKLIHDTTDLTLARVEVNTSMGQYSDSNSRFVLETIVVLNQGGV